MSRFTLVCAVISGIGAAACSFGMGDLSQVEPPSIGGANGGAAATDDPMLREGTSAAAPAESSSAQADDAASNAADAGVAALPKPAPNCELVTLTPTSAVSIGGGQTWRDPALALVGDGNPSTTPLSTDNRDSSYLQLSGFTGATIPATAVVKGLIVDVARGAGSNCIVAQEVTAVVGGADRVRTDVGDKWQGTRIYGSGQDTWGGAIAASTLNSSFAVRIKTRMVGNQQECPQEREARVDRLQVLVHYCAK